MTKLLTLFALTILFVGCSNEKPENNKELSYTSAELEIYREEGLKFAMATKAELGKNLISAINTKGTEHALNFCTIQAIPLTDSMSVVLNTTISRVSDKPRNPDNRATEQEVEIIQNIQTMMADGSTPKPHILPSGTTVIGYYPIITNEMCLQCHGGTGNEITPQTLAKIAEYYPSDEATGYSSGQIRGLFKVEMQGKK